MILRTIKTTRRSFKISDNHDLLNDNDMCSFSGYEVYDILYLQTNVTGRRLRNTNFDTLRNIMRTEYPAEQVYF